MCWCYERNSEMIVVWRNMQVTKNHNHIKGSSKDDIKWLLSGDIIPVGTIMSSTGTY